MAGELRLHRASNTETIAASSHCRWADALDDEDDAQVTGGEGAEAEAHRGAWEMTSSTAPAASENEGQTPLFGVVGCGRVAAPDGRRELLCLFGAPDGRLGAAPLSSGGGLGPPRWTAASGDGGHSGGPARCVVWPCAPGGGHWTVATGGEDGRVVVWGLGAGDGIKTAGVGMAGKRKHRSGKKAKSKTIGAPRRLGI